MNKLSVALALVVAFVGLAAANKFHRHHFNDDNDWDGEIDHCGGHIGHAGPAGCFRHHRHPHDLDEFDGGHFGGHQGGFGGRPHHPHPIRHKGFHHGKHLKRSGHRHPTRGAGGAIGGLGAIGAHNRRHDASLGGVGSSTHLGSSHGAEAHRNSLLAGEGHFDADQHRDSHSDDSGIRKHQVLNKDKTIIKDRTTGVNDVDGFHRSNSHSDGSSISGGISGLKANNVGGSVHSEKELDHDFGAVGGSEHSSESGAGAFGAGGAIGGIH